MPTRPTGRRRRMFSILGLAVLLVGVAAVAVAIGSVDIPVYRVAHYGL